MQQYNKPLRIVTPDGTVEWYENDQLHRADEPAVTCPSGHEEWWVNGKLHRVDEPAITHSDGYKEWWANGQRHRGEGPAITHSSDGYEAWYIDGEKVTSYHEYQLLSECSDSDILLYKLKYGEM